MNRLVLLLLAFSFFGIPCIGQKAFQPKIEKVFLDEKDTTKNCYTKLYPPKLPYNGYLFLMPGFGETAEAVLEQTDLPKQLALNGILTIIPTFQDGVLSFGVDRLSQQTFDRILNDVIAKHQLKGKKFYVGGFSIGGSCAIKYAENAVIKPTAVFAIDPPLDFERFYNSAKRDIRLSKDGEANPENIYMIERLEKETGGNPSTHLAKYYKISPYSFSDSTQTEIKKLSNIPLRIYTEPDINWLLQERGADFKSINANTFYTIVHEQETLCKLNNI